MPGVTWAYRAETEPSKWPMRSSMETFSMPRPSISVRWVCRRPCGVSPLAIGAQQVSARPRELRPRTGMPGQGSPTSGTGRDAPLAGYDAETAGANSHVAKLLRRRCGVCPTMVPPRTKPRSAMAFCTRVRVTSVTRSGWLRTLDTVPAEVSARRATSTSFAPWWPPVRTARCPRKTYVLSWAGTRGRLGPGDVVGRQCPQPGRQVDGAVAVVLGRAAHHFAVVELVQLPLDADGTGAYEAGPQADDFAPAHAGEGHEDHRDELVVGPDRRAGPLGDEQCAERISDGLFRSAVARAAGALAPPAPRRGRVGLDEASIDGVGQDEMEHRPPGLPAPATLPSQRKSRALVCAAKSRRLPSS